MSYHPNSFTPSGIALGQSSRHAVAPQAIQSAISTHQQNSAWIDKVPRGDKLTDSQIEFDAAKAAYSSGKMSTADFDAALRRFAEAGRDHDRRMADYTAREEAGQAKPADFFKTLYGYTDEEAEEFMHKKTRLLKMQIANRARSKSRMAHPSRHGRSH